MEKKPTEIKYEKADIETKPIQKFDTLWGLFRTESKIPTEVLATALANPTTHFYTRPTKFSDQVVIYTNDTTYRIYWYDSSNNMWHYVTATA